MKTQHHNSHNTRRTARDYDEDSRHFSKKAKVIFGNKANNALDKILKKKNISPKDVYSIDVDEFYYNK